MRIAVVGSRTFTDYNYLVQKLDELIFGYEEFRNVHEFEIVSGGARGADNLAELYAWFRHYPLKVFPADWNKHGRSAGYLRNKEIVNYSDIVVAFWDGQSKGTKHSINLAESQNKKIHIFTDWKVNDSQ